MRKYAAAVVLVWLVIAAVGGPLLGRLSEVQTNDNAAFLPPSAESTAVNQLSPKFTDTSTLPYLVVIERAGRPRPMPTRPRWRATWPPCPTLPLASAPSRKVAGLPVLHRPAAVIPSEDGKALLVPVSVDADKADDVVGGKTVLFEVAGALRSRRCDVAGTHRSDVHVTGPGGLLGRPRHRVRRASTAILLLVAARSCFVILLLVYRSPILPFAGAAAPPSSRCPRPRRSSTRWPRAALIKLNGQSQGILVDPGHRRGDRLCAAAGRRATGRSCDAPRAQYERDAGAPGGAASSRSPPAAARSSSALLCLLFSDLASPGPRPGRRDRHRRAPLLAALTFLPARPAAASAGAAFWPVPRSTSARRSRRRGHRAAVWGRVAALVGRQPRRSSG